jgi:NTP pyrophosphatase (non-canonical NTP hydrolase)
MAPSYTPEQPYNLLSAGQVERLALLAEELGEVQQAVGKILRHGLYSWNPTVVGSQSNLESLERELGDVMCAMGLLSDKGDIDRNAVWASAERKRAKVGTYMHHQREESEPTS